MFVKSSERGGVCHTPRAGRIGSGPRQPLRRSGASSALQALLGNIRAPGDKTFAGSNFLFAPESRRHVSGPK